MYGEAITEVVGWLTKAQEVAENAEQGKALGLLIKYYNTGDLEKWSEFNITWSQATEGDIEEYLEQNSIDTCFFVYDKYNFEGEIAHFEVEKVYSVYPNWIESITFIDWQKALNTHSIFILKRKNDNSDL